MSLTNNVHELLERLLEKPNEFIAHEQLIHCIDLTLLQENAPTESLAHLEYLAKVHPIAAVCVYSQDLIKLQVNNDVNLATVINFPSGKEELTTCIQHIDNAKQYGVNEIDYVVPYIDYLQGQRKKAINHARDIAAYCKEYNLSLKIILETGAFSNLETLYELAMELLMLDVDFLKTSTGKIAQGASLASAFTLLSAIKDSGIHCGIKVSGGVKTIMQAQTYAYLAQQLLNKKINNKWFRIGASSLLEELIKTPSLS